MMRFRVALCALLLASAPAWASRDCADGGDNLRATLGTTYQLPITIAAQFKVTDHPASGNYLWSIGETFGNFDSYISLRTGGAADSYVTETSNSAGTSDTISFQAGAGEFDNTWTGFVGVVGSTSSRIIYVGAAANTNEDTSTNDPGSLLDELVACDAMNDFGPLIAKVGELAVWDTAALSSAEVTDYLDNDCTADTIDTTGSGANLVAYYPLETSSLSDESGNMETSLTSNGAVHDAGDHPTMVDCSSGAAADFILQRRRLQ